MIRLLVAPFLFLFVGCQTIAPIIKTEKPKDEKSQLIQTVLDHPEMQPFFRPNSIDRLPLNLSSNLIGSDVDVEKFGKKIRVLPDEKIQTPAYLRFLKFIVKENAARVELEFPIEGLNARFWLEKPEGLWTVKQAYLTEF